MVLDVGRNAGLLLRVCVAVSLVGCTSSQQKTEAEFGPKQGIDLARSSLASGSPDLSLASSGSVLARSPGNVTALVLNGDALAKLGQVDEARSRYRAALAIDPHNSEALIGLGRLALTSDPAAAERALLTALKLEPRNPIAYNDLGIAEDLLGNHDAAQGNYRKAIALAPAMQAAEINLALSLAMTGQAGDARALLRTIQALPNPSPQLGAALDAIAAMEHNPAQPTAAFKPAALPAS